MKTARELIYQNNCTDFVFYEDALLSTASALPIERVEELMKEYAQEYAKEVLKAANENAETYEYPYMDACPKCGHTTTYIKEDSILNTPLPELK